MRIACSTQRSVYRPLVGKVKGKRGVERPTRRWVETITIHIREKWGYELYSSGFV
jgi:hypothetical protein